MSSATPEYRQPHHLFYEIEQLPEYTLRAREVIDGGGGLVDQSLQSISYHVKVSPHFGSFTGF